jgi:peptidoglycan-N-acetylglucosamine deacetylase
MFKIILTVHLTLVLSALCVQDADSEVFDWPGNNRAALSLSFDDGHGSQLDRGLPIFRRYGTKVTFYVLPFRVEKRVEDWKEALADGHEIGNHTLGHPCTGNFSWARADGVELEEYDLTRMHRELLEANEVIGQMLGIRPATFAYPCGQTYVGREADTKSYVRLVAEFFKSGRRWMDEVDNDPSYCDLSQIMARRMDGQVFGELRGMLDKAIADGRWLVLVGHHIGKRGEYTTDTEALRQLLEYVTDPYQRVWLAPVGEIAQYVRAQRNASIPDRQ